MPGQLLPPHTREIARATLDALQSADEMGGCDSTKEYVDLMDHLIAVLQTRRATALHCDAPPAPITVLSQPAAIAPRLNW